ncbi:hypothetical protein ACO2RV_24280 [Ancylobacter sp. VNQ12]|uniref:hypothetical protein n=1 Tax=Ancylobacter sp. VNQ12 TaxID=3400920 RepID=UPI003C03C3D9
MLDPFPSDRFIVWSPSINQAKLDALRADIAAGLQGPLEPLDMSAVKAEARQGKAVRRGA